jgi:hypothetical protein
MDVEMKEAPAEDPVVVGAQETYDRALAVADAQPQEAITALNEILATGMLKKCRGSSLARGVRRGVRSARAC